MFKFLRGASHVRSAALGAALLAMTACANAWTTKPVRVVVPAVAGGTMDVVARALADQLARDVGVPFIVDNKRGAGGNVAVGSLLGAPADGQTIMIAIDNILTEIPHVIKPNFSVFKDIKPVAAFARSSLVLVANTGLPAKDLNGLIAYLRTHPQQNTFASYAVGSASHYAGLMIGARAGINLQHVPFLGSPPALVQIMGGQTPFMFDGIATSLPLIRGGKLNALAVISPTRLPALPDVPTMAELGYPEISFSNLAVVITPAGVPPEVVAKIRAAVQKAAAAAPVQKRLADFGLEPVQPQSIEALEKIEKDGFERIDKIIKEFKVDLN
ncbi:Tripartite-type tricarboxylate transporter, receptor component TctC [Variovorax sp. OK605]|uniref:tripartite tricarboxylate transporter substrate binding protein n=1 Tax=unclassified Variovorax TaxID=663243 RepID=UPI0008D25A69|nr:MULTISPECIES: tripartite tricarboxylate transporter substrate binding protein [unclassified Variovorax]SEK16886.1 Tripartite-type tricarboxylate transporter, receptor component TctC [Variovorax sp. OK202]SFE63705.1 Tripartite-type tricarboxylate transporter, receptor component TctC [Variovorax sp. OK212]SFQ19350.1 Tripartite-type tricarboxylate transporter, receptor component TctC [Variovorax sp. OK605]